MLPIRHAAVLLSLLQTELMYHIMGIFARINLYCSIQNSPRVFSGFLLYPPRRRYFPQCQYLPSLSCVHQDFNTAVCLRHQLHH